MGANPPVMNPDMASHSPCSVARTGSMPANRHSTARMPVATRMTPMAILPMNWAVCTTLGTTCSLRPSDMYRLAPARLPNSPNESATTISPKPPKRCIMKRHMLSALERWSRSVMRLTPVVVPETPSNSASRYVP